MLDGELFKMTIRANRPMPWLGMPIYWKPQSKWHIIDSGDGGDSPVASVRHSFGLYSYERDQPAESTYILPGEESAPVMDEDFIDRLSDAYLWGQSFRCVDGLWCMVSDPPRDLIHKALRIPGGILIDDVFPNNGKVPVGIISSSELKSLNTDGRTCCAKCSGTLKQLCFGPSNLNHCPKCE
jgi:hypothetical protein